MTNQLIIPFRGLDANARPQSGARCYVYQTGTTTPVTVTNKSGTALPWPVVADINGAFPQMFYAGTLGLKAVIRSAADVTLPGGTIDPVPVVANVTAAANIALLPSDAVPQANVQAAIDAIGIRSTLIDGTGLTITEGGAGTTIGITTGVLTQIAAAPLGTGGHILRVNTAGTSPVWESGVPLMTPQVTTGGTSIDFSGIPATARRVTVMFRGVSTAGGQSLLVQIGATAIDATGYIAAASLFSGASTSVAAPTTSLIGFCLPPIEAPYLIRGTLVLSKFEEGANNWIATLTGSASGTNPSTIFGAGTKSLPAPLALIRITTATGADTFDAGAVNVSWE